MGNDIGKSYKFGRFLESMQQIEAESKVRVRDANSLRAKLADSYKFVGKEKKIDDYYALIGAKYPAKSVRIRRERDKFIINFKKSLSYKQGVHAKEEIEFSTSDNEAFFKFLEDFGFKKWIRKEKITETYRTRDGVNLELSYVRKLGWFLEIEILCKRSEIGKARQRVVQLRNELGISDKDVEKKGYTQELWKLVKK